MELKTCRRQKDESLQSVFHDIKRLMALAFLGHTGPMAEITAIDAFVDSFLDHELCKQVLQKRPATLKDALTWAVSIKAIDSRCTSLAPSFSAREETKEHRRPQRTYAHFAGADGSHTQRTTSTTRTHLSASRAHPQGRSPSKLRHLSSRFSCTSEPQQNMSRAATSPSPDRSSYACYNCSGLGHFSRDRASQRQRVQPLRKATSTVPGPHLGTVPAAVTTAVAPPVPPPAPPSTPRETGHANIVTWKRSTPETFIEIQIAGYDYRCLLDTGCDYSIIPCHLVPHAKLSPVHMDIFAANGAPISILGCMTVRFSIAGMPVTADLLVSEDTHEFLLGYDWLAAQGAHWFFDRKVLVLNGKKIP